MTALLSLLVACDGSGDHHPTDDTGDSEAALDLAPSLSADVSLVEGALGGELLVTLTVDDEDPEGVTLEAVLADDLVSGDLDGSVWVGTAGSEVGTSSLTFTATDAGGQTATLELPVEVYAARTWTGLMVLQGPTDEVLGLDMGVSSEGWTFAGGYAGTSAIASGLEPDGTMTWTAYYAADSEIGRGVAYDEATGTTALSSQKRVSGSNQGAPLVGLDDSGGEAWRASDAYYVSSGYTAGYYVAARDGVVVQAGPFLDTGAGVSGAWGRLIDAADGSDLGAPIAFSAHATAESHVGGVSLMDDGKVLGAGWAMVDFNTGAAASTRRGWVQVSVAGQQIPAVWAALEADGADVLARHAIQLGGGEVVVVGETTGELAQPLGGTRDAFIRLYDASGTELWTAQWGSSAENTLLRVAEGHDGAIYAVGSQGYDAGSSTDGEMVVLRYELDGTETWRTALAGDGAVRGRSVAFSGRDVVVAGLSSADMPDHGLIHAGGTWDSFIARLSVDGELQ
jgi:hypothetical protein